jgi:hypothetical protein
MNYHSSQNTTVMSTVFKMKAAILMVCALLVVSVSNALGQQTAITTFGVKITDENGMNAILSGDYSNGFIVSSDKVNIVVEGLYSVNNACSHAMSDWSSNWREANKNSSTTEFTLVDGECKKGQVIANSYYVRTSETGAYANDHVLFENIDMSTNGLHSFTMAASSGNPKKADSQIYYPCTNDYLVIKVTKEDVIPFAITSPESGTQYENDVTTAPVIVKGGNAGAKFFIYKGTDLIKAVTATATDQEYTVNVPLTDGSNLIKLMDADGVTVLGQISIDRKAKANPADAEGTVDGFRTWEIEVCQDPTKTAAEIGPDALTFSAVAVTHGKGHWENYPNQDAPGGTIVTPSSENTKINYAGYYALHDVANFKFTHILVGFVF